MRLHRRTAGRADLMSPAPLFETVVVRPGRPEDLARVVELFELGGLAPGKEDVTDVARYDAAWADIAAGPGGIMVAELEGEVVGALQLIVMQHLQNKGGLCAEVESVHVHPDFRGHGIGRVLMQTAIDRARDLGCYRVQLTSNSERVRAHAFYAALGFVPSHRGFKLVLG
jgi:GNAT superfamily N-acetyltransferase